MPAHKEGADAMARRKPRIIRPLGRLERMQSSLHLTRQYCGTLVTCRYAVPTSGTGGNSTRGSVEQLRVTFREAIAQTVLDHPLMQVGQLKEDSSAPSWVQLESLDLDLLIEWVSVAPEDDYDARLAELTSFHLDTPFPDLESTPGWRISVVRRENDLSMLDVIFAWNHANFDGMSGKIFHETLLRKLEANSSSRNAIDDSTNSQQETPVLSSTGVLTLPDAAKSFPPVPEELIKFPISPRYTVSTVIKELKPPFMIGKNETFARWCPIRTDLPETSFRTFAIEPHLVESLITMCRQKKTTITGLLHALAMISLAVRLRENAKFIQQKDRSLSAITALDHRRFMPVHPASHPWYNPPQTMSNVVSAMTHVYPGSIIENIQTQFASLPSSSEMGLPSRLQDIMWSAAAKTRQEIQTRLDSGLKDDITGLMKFVGDWRAQMRNNAKRPRSVSWSVTNLGIINGSGGDGWNITRATFQLSTEVTAGAFHISVVSVKGGQMVVDVSWQKCVVDVGLAESLAADLEAWLKYFGETGI